ncbi:unnamed protein product [Pseudo-nitzschia multistriata]|uniref:Uncharacterized protein n=1 Tax=Pseudo-nitzschia multistriata TaxID=183589 RepID=A0A448Z7V1_9STRA|nr:unnamed protein product [Pseudo-nitzschia multistriata]
MSAISFSACKIDVRFSERLFRGDIPLGVDEMLIRSKFLDKPNRVWESLTRRPVSLRMEERRLLDLRSAGGVNRLISSRMASLKRPCKFSIVRVSPSSPNPQLRTLRPNSLKDAWTLFKMSSVASPSSIGRYSIWNPMAPYPIRKQPEKPNTCR